MRKKNISGGKKYAYNKRGKKKDRKATYAYMHDFDSAFGYFQLFACGKNQLK